MVKYEYDVDYEVFKRVKPYRGKHLAVNIVEANRIINLMNLGYSANRIIAKVHLSNPKASQSTVKSFIRNYEQGNIEMPVDAPAPVRVFESISDSDRISALEERVTKLELVQKETTLEKVKKWIKS